MQQGKNKICFVSVDVEGKLDNLDKILEIFKKYNISATLFVTGEILEQHRDLFKELSRNHEIACHSFTHRFWDILNKEERERELEKFISLYQSVFNEYPKGFRAPSHIIDEEGLGLLAKRDFLYDSSIVPHYPPLKKYRGYRKPSPLLPYCLQGRKILEIPVRGQIFGIPLSGVWLNKLPFWLYKVLFFIDSPEFITLSIHSWDELNNFEKIIKLLENKNYQFLNGGELYKNYR